MREDQTISEMVEEVLARQAKALASRSGQPLEAALEGVADTEAGRQLREVAHGEHRHEKVRDWQTNLLWERAEGRLMHLVASDALSRFRAERHYSWLQGYMEWLEGKEERAEYHALLEEELASLSG
jgi:plasmid stabilization system protein ParE